MSTDYETLLFERTEEGIGILRLNRPKAYNAINSTLITELEALLTELHGAGLRALIVTGVGKAFAAGADIKQMADFSALKAADFAQIGQRALGLLETFPAPTIAAVNGYALGGGCELAMCADLILAGQRAVFGQPEVKLGVIPGFGGTICLLVRLRRRVAGCLHLLRSRGSGRSRLERCGELLARFALRLALGEQQLRFHLAFPHGGCHLLLVERDDGVLGRRGVQHLEYVGGLRRGVNLVGPPL